MNSEAQTAAACPECGSAQVRRSHRKNSLEMFLSERMRRDPYRCDNCLARFFRYRAGDPAERVYRAPSATPKALTPKMSHGQTLQQRRRLVLVVVGGVSAMLLAIFMVAFRGGGHEPSPVLMRITRMFGASPAGPAAPARRRR
jgi:predicted RNA-binding Zn-ribbon protein involved in translation (DUF1610 family)